MNSRKTFWDDWIQSMRREFIMAFIGSDATETLPIRFQIAAFFGVSKKNNILDWVQYVLGGFAFIPLKNTVKLFTEYTLFGLKEAFKLLLNKAVNRYDNCDKEMQYDWATLCGVTGIGFGLLTALWAITRTATSPIRSFEEARKIGGLPLACLSAIGSVVILSGVFTLLSIFSAPALAVAGIAKIPVAGPYVASALTSAFSHIGTWFAPVAQHIGTIGASVVASSVVATGATTLGFFKGLIEKFSCRRTADKTRHSSEREKNDEVYGQKQKRRSSTTSIFPFLGIGTKKETAVDVKNRVTKKPEGGEITIEERILAVDKMTIEERKQYVLSMTKEEDRKKITFIYG